MLKKTITFEDYNGQIITEDFYFNLTKAELVELELSQKEGFAEALQEIVKSEDGKLIIENFKKIILLAYGQKSVDGRRFIKSKELQEEFSQTEAYSTLFVELATDANSATTFINGIVPAGMAPNIEDIELPPETPALEGVITTPQEVEKPAWIREDREPTQIEVANMTRVQLLEAMRKKNQE